MKNPAQYLIARCDTGFYLWQKVALTVLAAAYVGSPVDLLPDLIPVICWGDDIYVIYLLIRVWKSPTLPNPSGLAERLAAVPCRQRSSASPVRVPVVRREKVGGVS